MALATLSTSYGLGQPEAVNTQPLALKEQLLAEASTTCTFDTASRRESSDLDRDSSFGTALSDEDMQVNIGTLFTASNFEGDIDAFERASTHAISDFERFSLRDPADLDQDIEFTQLLQQSLPVPRTEAPLLPGVDILRGEDPFVALLMQDRLGDPNAVLALLRNGGLEAQGQLLHDEDLIDALLEDPGSEWLRGRTWPRMDTISSASTATLSSLISESDDDSYEGTLL